MNVANTLSGAQFIAASSSLKAANKQPQLALELILKSVAAVQTAGAAQSPPPAAMNQPSQVTPTGVAGSIIDTYG